MAILLSTLFFALFLGFLLKHPMFKMFVGSRRAFAFLFAIKVLSAFALTAVYTWYYTDRSTADIYKYFDDATVIYDQLHQTPQHYFRIMFGVNTDTPEIKQILDKTSFWFKEFDYRLYNDNRTIIRLNALIMLVSFGHFAVHNVIMSFLSFIGLFFVFRLFYEQAPQKRWPILFAVFCIPNVLFWASGVLKESFLLFLFGSFLYLFHKIVSRQLRFKSMILVVLFALFFAILLSITKYYVILCAIPGLIFWGYSILKNPSKKKSFHAFIILFASVFGFILLNQYVFHFYDFFQTISLKHNDFVAMAQSLPNTGSLVETFRLQPTLADFLVQTPHAFSKAFLQPFPWQIKSLPMLLAAVENLFFLLLATIVVLRFDRSIGFRPIVVFSLLFIFFLFWLNGLVTPVLGALVRYKVPALPFLAAVLVLYIDFERIPLLKRMVSSANIL